MIAWLTAVVVFFCTSSALALGLGDIQGRAVIGRPLSMTIPILGTRFDARQDACATLLPDGDEENHASIRIRLDGADLQLSTTRALNQPILQFRIRLGCSDSVERSFVVLADPPGSDVPATPAATPTPVAENVTPPSVAEIAPPVPGTSKLVLASSTSLRMLSRQRYPADSRTRVSFIRRLAAANPALFASPDDAFDQVLPAGTSLAVPAGVPEPHTFGRTASAAAVGRRTDFVAPRQAPAVAAAAPSRPASGAGRGRLIIGAGGLSAASAPTAAELNESIDRLTEVLNQQVMVQIAATHRLKAVEAELAELKSQASAERRRVAQLESDLKTVRETAERSGAIQLVLAILLGGAAGAAGLNWVARRRKASELAAAAVPPALTIEPERPVQAMPSAFGLDDLLPPAASR